MFKKVAVGVDCPPTTTGNYSTLFIPSPKKDSVGPYSSHCPVCMHLSTPFAMGRMH